jgi:hypothetical protein
MNNLNDIKDVVDILSALVIAIGGFVGGFIGIRQYQKQNTLKRAEHFHTMRKKLKESEAFRNICVLLTTDDSKIKDVGIADKSDFLGFFEEIAIMVESKIISKHVAHYMFGYYAIKCYDNENGFWDGDIFYKKDDYWSLFIKFAEDMKNLEKKFKFKQSNYKI